MIRGGVPEFYLYTLNQYYSILFFINSGSISDLRGFGSGLARFEAGSANENRGTQLAQLAHVNVDDLSDDGLANIIDELKTAVRRFALETIMFEGIIDKQG